MVQNLFVEPADAARETSHDKHSETDFPLGIHGFTYGDLHRPARLRALAEAFYAEVGREDAGLHARLAEYVNSRGENLKGTRAESELLIEAAPHLSRFVARLFRVEEERERLAESIRAQDPVFQFKQFVQRRATKSFPAERAAGLDWVAAGAALEALRHAAFADTLADDRELGVARMTVRLLEEVNYCLYCHERDKDSCSKGLKERDGSLKKNPLGIKLTGCPLDEKISEMHVLHRDGDPLAALALVVIDNPMCPGTGHRICNDCMKSCIFQKQEPVNIPQAETGVLTNVLSL